MQTPRHEPPQEQLPLLPPEKALEAGDRMRGVPEERCAGCGMPWEESRYCPWCEEERQATFACPGCGGTSPDPGEWCPACEDDRMDEMTP